jgi:hypothetical protein
MKGEGDVAPIVALHAGGILAGSLWGVRGVRIEAM